MHCTIHVNGRGLTEIFAQHNSFYTLQNVNDNGELFVHSSAWIKTSSVAIKHRFRLHNQYHVKYRK